MDNLKAVNLLTGFFGHAILKNRAYNRDADTTITYNGDLKEIGESFDLLLKADYLAFEMVDDCDEYLIYPTGKADALIKGVFSLILCQTWIARTI